MRSSVASWITRRRFTAAWLAANRFRLRFRSSRIACGSTCSSTGGNIASHRGAEGPAHDESLAFVCELGRKPYAIIDRDGRDTTDRWAEWLMMRDWARELFRKNINPFISRVPSLKDFQSKWSGAFGDQPTSEVQQEGVPSD